MSQEKQQPDQQPASDTTEPATPETQAMPESEAPGDEISELKALTASLKDRLLRQMAEMENLRKRTEREKSEASRYAISRFAVDMVTVADTLHRALASVPAGARENIEDVKNLVEGVAATERQLLQNFERHGLKRFDPIGERFDPEFHEAMFEMPDPSRPAGTVAQVIEAGYMIGDRVLRPARVGVARGGPKLAPAPAHEETRPADPKPAAAEPEAPAGPGPQDANQPHTEPKPGLGKKIDTSA